MKNAVEERDKRSYVTILAKVPIASGETNTIRNSALHDVFFL